VRLCPDGSDPEATFTTPADLLTDGVSGLIDTINSTPLLPLSNSCSRSYTRTFRVVFGYPDGTRITLLGRVTSSAGMDGSRVESCDRLGLPGAWRSGGLLRALRSAWLHQRADSRTGQAFPSPHCSMLGTSLFAADLTEVTTAIVCGRGVSDQGRAGLLTASQTQALLADMAQHSSPGGDDTQSFSTIINLFTPWGELITVYRSDGSDRWGFYESSRSGLMWTPSAAIRAWLDPTVDGALPTSSPSSTR